VSFTFGGDYIGGPQAGWVRTDFLEELASARIRQDLTVEAAIAISGAAFASAMGSKSSFYEVFLALSNARLGAWLPRPVGYFVALKLQHLDDWTIPGLPATRRLSYFAREIFGIHPGTGRMLLCTDGGHYDNLGLWNAVVIGDIIYPAVGGLGEAQGEIVLARATLTSDVPHQLLDFTQNDPRLPEGLHRRPMVRCRPVRRLSAARADRRPVGGASFPACPSRPGIRAPGGRW